MPGSLYLSEVKAPRTPRAGLATLYFKSDGKLYSKDSDGTEYLCSWDGDGVIPPTEGGTGLDEVATGDLLYGSAADTWSALAVGDAGKLLRSTGTLPAWSTVTLADTFAQGSIPHAATANTLSALTLGSAGQVLRSNGTTLAYSTATFPNTAAAGDLLHGSAANTWASLAKGAARQLLQMNSGATLPEWTSNVDIPGTLDVTGNTTLDGTLAVTGNATFSERLFIAGTGAAAGRIIFSGTHGGAGESISYEDSRGTARTALAFYATDVVALSNRASNGTVQIRANTATAGAGGEVTVATFEDTGVTLSGALNFGSTAAINLSGAVLHLNGASNIVFNNDTDNNATTSQFEWFTDAANGGGTRLMRLTADSANNPSLYIGDVNNANMTAGITLNQGAADNEIIALKSSDINHGKAGTETDTYGTGMKAGAATGGLLLTGYGSGEVGVKLAGGSGNYVVLASSKSTTGDPTGEEGMLVINTFDNALKMYCDGAWRTLASW